MLKSYIIFTSYLGVVDTRSNNLLGFTIVAISNILHTMHIYICMYIKRRIDVVLLIHITNYFRKYVLN